MGACGKYRLEAQGDEFANVKSYSDPATYVLNSFLPPVLQRLEYARNSLSLRGVDKHMCRPEIAHASSLEIAR